MVKISDSAVLLGKMKLFGLGQVGSRYCLSGSKLAHVIIESKAPDPPTRAYICKTQNVTFPTSTWLFLLRPGEIEK